MSDTAKFWICIAIMATSCISLGFLAGRDVTRRKYAGSEPAVEVRRDTVWKEVHDTAFIERSRSLIRHDTVRLAVADTAYIYMTDSVYVEIPVERRVFEGENYRITATGYRVALQDVWFSYPEVTAVETRTRRKRWAFGIGVQAGYGMTLHGLSPYAGVGASFGYTF